jgi:uncharacterized membrane protein
MARIVDSVEIKRPVDQVFTYVTEIKNFPKWIPDMQEAVQVSPGNIGVGTSLRGMYKMMGLRMAWTSKITEYEPNKKFGEKIISGNVLTDELMTFDSTSEGTRFTFLCDLTVGGVLKLLSPIMASSMRKQTKTDLAKLKELLESQIRS